MNIFLLTETRSGCYKWRAAIPAIYLKRRGHQVHVFDAQAEPAALPDVVVFYRAHYPKAAKLLAWCKKNGIRTVFDTDDAIDLVPPENLNYSAVQTRLELYHGLLGAADVVTTTTDTLAVHLRKSNPNVVVIPNSVDPEEWTVRPRASGVRVGWTGSPTHFSDLAVALAAVRELQKQRDFVFVLQGICMESSLDDMYQAVLARKGKSFLNTPLGRAIAHFMRELEGIHYEFYPGVAVDRHASTVCDLALDIGLAPLIDDAFNRHKSCIKYYEYAMSGAVTLASRVLPYSTEVSLVAKNNREAWKDALHRLLDHDRQRLWREQRDWVLTHRNIERTVELWERVLSVSDQPHVPRVKEEICLQTP